MRPPDDGLPDTIKIHILGIMEAPAIMELLERDPFRPFRIKLSNQETVDVRNPSLVVVLKREIFIADPSRDGFHIYSLMHVVGIEPLQAA